MRIRIRTKDIRMKLVLPNWLVLNHLSIQIGHRIMANKVPDFQLSKADMYKIAKVIRQTKKTHGKYELVSIQANDGTIVEICL